MSQINIQFTLYSAFYTPLILTMAGGFLKEQGLDYQWSVAAPGKSAVEAIANGSADVIQTALIQNINDLENNRVPVSTNFAQINEMDGFFISAREADPAFEWSKLEGSEVVMFGGGQPNAMFRYACHKAGIDYNKIIPVTPGGPADIDREFRDGNGKYVQQQGPYPQQLAAENLGEIVAQVGPMIGPCAFSSLAARPDWLSSETAIAFTKAYRNTRNFLNQSNPAEITTLIDSWFPETEFQALRNCVSTYQKLGCWTPHIEITQEAFEVTQDVFEHSGSLSKRYHYNDICSLPPAV